MLAVLIIITVIIGIGIGSSPISFMRLIYTFLGKGTPMEKLVLFDIRLPRIAITLLCGIALSVSGSILQGVTGNDLADPGIIGINVHRDYF